ncbi:MAG: ABC transporter substrate-binding protein [Deltaproteobacteria bacterium]|nr:MAG: ABC transporter substrate-binding protein [Deltaproteobacteria bacterium]
MNKIICISSCLLFVFFTATVGAQVKNPDTFVLADYRTVQTIDPAASYDVAGSMRIWNLYETLIFFDGSSTEKFVPLLATEVPTVENGGISPDGKRYTFLIRKGVKFHEGGVLTPEDVVYSFKRNMIMDPDGGPMWMLLEALTGKGSTRDKEGKIIDGIFDIIDQSVEARGDRVVFHLPKPYPPLMSIFCYTASSVVDKEWAISKGCWDGNIKNAAKYNNAAPGHEPLQKIENGTGPFKMKRWEPAKQFVFERFEGYWGPKPQIKTGIAKYVKEWSTRKLMLQNGDADRVVVDTPYVPEVKAMKGLKIYEVPQLAFTAGMFCRKINPTGNPNIGSGKLDGNGIPPDFFSDINVRKAFLHAFDRETYKKDVFHDLVIMPTSPNVKGLPYHQDVSVYEFNLEKAAEYMQRAWGGKVWENGFKMIITHNTGNEMREAAAVMLAENIMSLNPKFKIEVRNVEWKDYIVQIRDFQYPMFMSGWGADYADPHNFVYPFMHSNGYYGRFMALKNDEIDRWCDEGIENVDPQKRREIYSRLQNIWYEDAIGIPLYQQIVVRAYRDYVHGFVPNAMFTDDNEILKRIWKK